MSELEKGQIVIDELPSWWNGPLAASPSMIIHKVELTPECIEEIAAKVVSKLKEEN